MQTIHFDLEDSKMRSCRKRVIIALAAICMFSGLTLASEQILQTGKTTNTVSIQPTDAVLFELPTGQRRVLMAIVFIQLVKRYDTPWMIIPVAILTLP